MCVVETKDAEQANKMKLALEEKYDHLTISGIGVALGVQDNTTTDGETDSDSSGDEKEDNFSKLTVGGGGRSPLPQRKRLGSFRNKAGDGLQLPIAGVNSGRRGSMMVQTIVKTPQWKMPDNHIHSNEINWSTRATHYPVHSSH